MSVRENFLVSPPPNLSFDSTSIEFTEHESALLKKTGRLSMRRIDGREKSLFSSVGLNDEETEFGEAGCLSPPRSSMTESGRISGLCLTESA